MNFDSVERLWAADGNRLSPAAEAEALDSLDNALRSRRRRVAAWMIFTGVQLVLLTGLFGWVFLAGHAVPGRREWAVPLLLAIPWVGFVVFTRQFLRHLKAFPAVDRPVPQNLRALLDENLTTQRRARIMAVMHAVFAVFAAIAMTQLVTTGKMTVGNAWQAATLFGAVLAVSAVVQAVIHFGFTVPEGQRLRRLLLSYDAE